MLRLVGEDSGVAGVDDRGGVRVERLRGAVVDGALLALHSNGLLFGLAFPLGHIAEQGVVHVVLMPDFWRHFHHFLIRTAHGPTVNIFRHKLLAVATPGKVRTLLGILAHRLLERLLAHRLVRMNLGQIRLLLD